MAEREERKPREFYTRALIRICEKLDSQDTYELHWKDRYLHRECRGVLRADSLWVVGSYARGASTCGDLDLVLKLSCLDGVRADHARFVSEALPRSSGVRYYEGDPDENSSGVRFPEAVHIWSKGFDWREATESIALDSNAQRFHRPSDEMPLRPEQLYGDLEAIETLLKRRAEGEIDWRFYPIDVGDRVEVEASGDWEKHLARYLSLSGKRTRDLLPHLSRYLRENGGPLRSRLSSGATRTELQFEGTFVTLGRPWLAHARLDRPTVSRVVLIPHLSGRGPNGVWELRRGARHPLEERIRNVGAYGLSTVEGTLSRVGHGARHGGECEVVELFSTAALADEYAKEEAEMDGPALTPTWIEGSNLLDTLSYADAIEIHTGNGEFTLLCLTHMGRSVFSEDDESIQVASTDQIMDSLAEAFDDKKIER